MRANEVAEITALYEEPIHATHEQTMILLKNLSSSFVVSEQAMDLMKLILPECAAEQSKHIENWQKAAKKLMAEFSQHLENTQNDKNKLNHIHLEQQDITIKEFNQLFSKTLSGATDKIVTVSKQSIMMVYMLDEAMSSLASVQSFINQIKAINKQANMLAVNASIEAVRAGQLGENFAVVAREIKTIAEDIKDLSGSLHNHIQEVSKTVTAGYDILQEIATTDLTENIESKEQLDAMLASITTRNEEIDSLLQTNQKTEQELLSQFAALTHESPATKELGFALNSFADILNLLKENQRISHQEIKGILSEEAPPHNVELVTQVLNALQNPRLAGLFKEGVAGKKISLEHAMSKVRLIQNKNNGE